MNADKPRFIRRNGRIIPIGVKKDKVPRGTQTKAKSFVSENKKALMFTGAGLASIGGFGYLAGKLGRKAAKIGAESVSMTKTAAFAGGHLPGTYGTDLGKRVSDILLRGSIRRAKKTQKYLAGSKLAFGFGATVVGGALLSRGIESFLKSRKKKPLSDTAEISSDVAAYATAGLGSAAFSAGFGKNLLKRILSGGKL